MISKQTGFTLIAAIFLLVVVAGLVAYAINIRVVQQTTLVYGVQGARALQAARSGLEWGIARSFTLNACPAPAAFVIPDTALNAFNVTVTCTETAHTEGATTIEAYRLTSTATSGGFGTLDFIQRGMLATVSLDPP